MGGLYLERKKKKECYVGFPVLTQLSSASGRKVRTTAFLKGAKQPPAFPKNPPKLLHKKKAIYSSTRRWIMSVEIYCYKKLGFFFDTEQLYYKYLEKSSIWKIQTSHKNHGGEKLTLYRILHLHSNLPP